MFARNIWLISFLIGVSSVSSWWLGRWQGFRAASDSQYNAAVANAIAATTRMRRAMANRIDVGEQEVVSLQCEVLARLTEVRGAEILKDIRWQQTLGNPGLVLRLTQGSRPPAVTLRDLERTARTSGLNDSACEVIANASELLTRAITI
jgi:hypothetical protein